MKYQFNTTEEKVNEGIGLVKQNGGVFYKDGTFEISGVEGKTHFSNNVLTVLITNKPFLASWGMIETKLKSFFN